MVEKDGRLFQVILGVIGELIDVVAERQRPNSSMTFLGTQAEAVVWVGGQKIIIN